MPATNPIRKCPHVSIKYDARGVPYCPNCGAIPHPEVTP